MKSIEINKSSLKEADWGSKRLAFNASSKCCWKSGWIGCHKEFLPTNGRSSNPGVPLNNGVLDPFPAVSCAQEWIRRPKLRSTDFHGIWWLAQDAAFYLFTVYGVSLLSIFYLSAIIYSISMCVPCCASFSIFSTGSFQSAWFAWLPAISKFDRWVLSHEPCNLFGYLAAVEQELPATI